MVQVNAAVIIGFQDARTSDVRLNPSLTVPGPVNIGLDTLFWLPSIKQVY
jgi:hypothetical protein